MNIFNQIQVDLSIPEALIPVIQIAIYIILGIIAYRVIKHIANKVASNKNRLKKRHHQKRAETIKSVVLNVAKYIITIIVFIAILASLGVDVTTLVAGLGITGVLIGLAFQDLARDLIAGLSIVAEDQYEIGDIVEIGGFKGRVIFVGLRTTRIRDFQGATKIIPNSRITDLINYNLHDSLVTVDLRFPLATPVKKIEKVLETVSVNAIKQLPKAKSEVQILGMEMLDNISLTYRIAVEVPISTKIDTERILRKEIKLTLEKSDINM